MRNPPQTLEEAKHWLYIKWAKYQEGCCAYEAFYSTQGVYHQCSRKNGHGPAGLYCWQHAAKMVES